MAQALCCPAPSTSILLRLTHFLSRLSLSLKRLNALHKKYSRRHHTEAVAPAYPSPLPCPRQPFLSVLPLVPVDFLPQTSPSLPPFLLHTYTGTHSLAPPPPPAEGEVVGDAEGPASGGERPPVDERPRHGPHRRAREHRRLQHARLGGSRDKKKQF